MLDINLQHENHNLDKATFNHYPENMRVDAEKLENVKKMVELGVKKHKLKVDLMSDETKPRLERWRHFGKIIGTITTITTITRLPNTIVRVVTNAENELVGKYFLVSIYSFNRGNF